MPSEKPKKILFITFGYPPETSATAKRLGNFAKYFTDNGWEVTTATQLPHHPNNKIKEGYESKFNKFEEIDGVSVFRIKPWIVERGSFVKRFMAEMRFCFLSFYHMRSKKFDVIYATCPYMFTAFSGYLLSRNNKAFSVLEFRDITWRYIKSSGKKSFGMEKILEKLMLWVSKKASMIVTTTNGQLKYFLDRGVEPKYKLVVPNGVSEEFIDLFKDKSVTINTNKEEYSVVYAGLIGFPQSLQVIVDAAEILPDVTFYIIGDGAEKEMLVEKVKDRNLKNVKFPGYLSLDELIKYYEKADVLMAHLKDDPIFKITQPSKVWEYMVTGTPVIYGGSGEAAEAVKKSNGGLVFDPENAEQLAEKILHLKNNPDKAMNFGIQGKKYVLENVRRDRYSEELTEKLSSIITN